MRDWRQVLLSRNSQYLIASQLLAEWAEMRAALSNDDLLDWCAAARAGLALAVVDIEMFLVGAWLTVAVAIIAQGAATVLKPLKQRQANAGVQPCDLAIVQAIAGAQRVQLSIPERLIGVDIANAGDDFLVEQQRLEARP